MKIAFTSCMDATRVPDQPIWKYLLEEHNPDVLMLLGDQIYMDWGDLFQSNWKRRIDKDDNEHTALDRYAREMYMRYHAQWNVPGFAELVRHMKDDDKPIVCTWDDHDFAWNNAVAVGEKAKHYVRPSVVKVSRRMFFAFAKALDTGVFPAWNEFFAEAGGTDDKPGAHRWTDPPGTVWGSRLLAPRGRVPVDCMVLDTRSERSERDDKKTGAQILGPDQEKELRAKVAAPAGLLLLAAGSPLKHKHLLSEQDWVGADDEPSYPEYGRLLNAVKRPVVYLAGDIHRASWGGRVTLSANGPARIMQVLASPAAIDRFGPKNFVSTFGLMEVRIASTEAARGSVDTTFYRELPGGGWKPDPQTQMNFADGEWTGEVDGEAGKDDAYLAGEVTDTADLSVLINLSRAGDAWERPLLSASLEELELIDECYLERPQQSSEGGIQVRDMGLPEPAVVNAVPGKVPRLEVRVEESLVRKRKPHERDLREDKIDEVILAAFKRARDKPGESKSVVLFIHGLGKSPVNAFDQGYALRHVYPQCEPIVYCWPAGRGNGLLSGLFNAGQARDSAPAVVGGLQHVLRRFAILARQEKQKDGKLAAVVAARSAGTNLLSLALWNGDTQQQVNGLVNVKLAYGMEAKELEGVDRIVLSASGIEVSEFKQRSSVAFWQPNIPQTIVTVNRKDQTLQFGRFTTRPGPSLGICNPEEAGFEIPDNALFLDFTESDSVGPLHDYLLVAINPDQWKHNRAILCDKVYQPETGGTRIVKVP